MAAVSGEAASMGSCADAWRPPASSSFRACIHRGAHEIGGTCVELACEGARVLLDLGMPLGVEQFDPALLPDVAGL